MIFRWGSRRGPSTAAQGYPLLPAVGGQVGRYGGSGSGRPPSTPPVEEYDKNNVNLQEAVQMLNSESPGAATGATVWAPRMVGRETL